MNKFLTNLTNSDDKALNRRAESINSRAKMTQEALINKLKLKLEEKKLQLADLTDLGPENKNSLVPSASTDWNPEKWVNEIQQIKLDIRDYRIQLKEALETYEEFFLEKEEEKKEIKES